eukprot:TRINITY_DN2041_c0_g1_i3.p2 TRINITY_DN2041_c0_g1~~TRINITY_DN2041_c0_g1_i3.p2  ORF type:complete len:125 (-),score=21.50 TRINITY_DN2041_c0_g1_i3:225-599(-)
MSYRQESDVWVPFLNYDMKHSLLKPPSPSKTKLAIAFINDCGLIGESINFYKALKSHLEIDHMGCWIESDEETLERIRSYKFMIFFENCFVNDLVTRKIYQALQVGTIPGPFLFFSSMCIYLYF